MELRIKPFPKNTYPKKGLLIKGSSPVLWLHEMEVLGIDLEQVRSYAVPAKEPNILYGCFLIFPHEAPKEIGKNAYFQGVDDKLFIPENTIFYPKINPEDWQQIDAVLLIMHPDFGMVKVKDPIDWISLIQDPEKTSNDVRKPVNGVKIPQTIKSYTVEMDDEKILEALQKPKTEEEWMKNLPFDLKKVMAGNKKEIEKYLKYIEQYPDRAVDLGVPLDIMGTSRGDGFGKFSFDKSWFASLLGRGSSEGEENKSRRNFRWAFWTVLVMAIIARIAFDSDKNNTQNDIPKASSGTIENGVKSPSDLVAFQSGFTEIDHVIDSIYWGERRRLSTEYITATAEMSKSKEEQDQYKKSGGRPVGEVGNDLEKTHAKEKQSRDSLKTIYNKKIAQQVENKSEQMKRRLSDSLKEYVRGKPVNGDVVKYLLTKKKALMADSLGRLYGTIGEPEMSPTSNKDSGIKTVSSGKEVQKGNISFMDIIFLILFMVGGVAAFSFVLKRKSINIGGENVPPGIKILLMIILVAMLIYLFYPLIEYFGYNWFVWILIICVILLLYRLFEEDKTILKSDDHE
jgi:hypothetical protein